jgi:hypothetical protein
MKNTKIPIAEIAPAKYLRYNAKKKKMPGIVIKAENM